MGAFIQPHSDARRFALFAAGWSLALFGVLRLPPVEQALLMPVTQAQGHLAALLFGIPALPIQVTLACSGSDAIALCAGFIWAYPARWQARAAAVAGGMALILALNTIRIGTLGLVTAPVVFDALHVYLWPALLILAIAAYVFAWMWSVDAVAPSPAITEAGVEPAHNHVPLKITRRFLWTTGIMLVIFTSAAPLYLDSAAILAVAGSMARIAAEGLRALGVDARAEGNVLFLARGGFVVTQECITTPLIPVYVAAVVSYARQWRTAAILLLATIPLFIVLGILRLLVVALPPAIGGSSTDVVHGFYQFLAAAVLVGGAAAWRHGAGRQACRRAVVGTVTGCLVVYVLAALYEPLIVRAFPLAVSPGDSQGAVRQLAAFQVGLFAALCAVVFKAGQWRGITGGLALLALSQVVVFALLHVLQGMLSFAPHVRDVRGWALAAPVLLVVMVVSYARPRP